jgi:anthranilate synthase component 2
MLLMIDNYDSFTYNLVQYFGELGAKVKVYRNDEITLEQIGRLAPEHLVISPGPCSPAQAGISVAGDQGLRRQATHPGRLPRPPEHRRRPLAGASCTRRSLMHGKTSPVHHIDARASSAACPIRSPARATIRWPSNARACPTVCK